MKTAAALNTEIKQTFDMANNPRAERGTVKKCRDRLPFLKMCALYVESNTPESIRASLDDVNKKIALHEQQIAESTVKMQPSAAKTFAADYGERVGLPRLRDYQKSLAYICDVESLQY
jgi:hypothetical protein